MPKPNARLALRLSPVTSNQEPGRYMRLAIEDIVSGHRVAEFELIGEHLLDLLGNRQVGGADGMPAWLIEAKERETLGMRTFTTERGFDAASYTDGTVEEWASRFCGKIGADKFSVRRDNNNTLRARFVYFTHADNDADVIAINARRQATMDALVAPIADR